MRKNEHNIAQPRKVLHIACGKTIRGSPFCFVGFQVVVATGEVVRSALESGQLQAQQVACVVLDEAHYAVGRPTLLQKSFRFFFLHRPLESLLNLLEAASVVSCIISSPERIVVLFNTQTFSPCLLVPLVLRGMP